MSADKIAAIYSATFHDALARGMSETQADNLATQAAMRAASRMKWRPC